MNYRELGLIATLLSWGAVAYLITKWRGKRSMSLSLHAASTKQAYYFFGAVLLTAGCLFSIFMYTWFIPRFGLPDNFTILFSATMLCMFTAVIVPETQGIKRTIHLLSAITFAFLLFITTLVLLLFCSLTIPTLIIGITVIAFMFFCMAAFMMGRTSPEHMIKKHYLVFETLYLVSFQLFILAAAYMG